jgi:hypothetical protein
VADLHQTQFFGKIEPIFLSDIPTDIPTDMMYCGTIKTIRSAGDGRKRQL